MKKVYILLSLLLIGCTQPMILTTQDLNELDLRVIDCNREEYKTGEYSPLAEYHVCTYQRENTQIVVEIKRYTDPHELNGSYQYSSLHLRGFEGLISEDEYGDMSRFYVNNESDIYYYHLWIAEDNSLIHVTSKGKIDAIDYVPEIGQRIMQILKN